MYMFLVLLVFAGVVERKYELAVDVFGVDDGARDDVEVASAEDAVAFLDKPCDELLRPATIARVMLR